MKAVVLKHREKIMYLIVGMWNTVFGYGLFAGLYYLLSKSLNYNVILFISYVVSTINAYLLYKYLVFQTKGDLLRGYLRFSVVYVYAYVGNMVILFGLKRFTSIDLYMGQAISVIVIVLVSYFSHKKFTFKHR
ncbi:MAG: GtrA family protein [Chlorobiales bacterium]|nr:GtrA family protein [Chlorobiales bacterium]